MSRTIEVDGKELEIASLLRRGSALAVNLCVAVFVSSLLLFLVSLVVPLDAKPAGLPILLVVLAAVAYLLWARDYVLPSLGRQIFGLRLLGIQGPMPRFLRRPLTVLEPTTSKEELNRAMVAAAVVATSSVLGLFVLGMGLTSTTVHSAVAAHVQRTAPFTAAGAPAPQLARFPRSLLIGKKHAYVQSKVRWVDREGTLEFFLLKDRAGWQVSETREVEPSRFGKYSLSVLDEEVPKP